MKFDFNDLFIGEIANNHLASVERGLAIIDGHARMVRAHGVRAALKIQVRDADTFVHKDYRDLDDRYVRKTLASKLTFEEYATLVRAIRKARCLTMCTPFDERSVDTCHDLDIEILKMASADVADWPLLERCVYYRKPLVISTGGTSERDLDAVVEYVLNRDIPLALLSCVAHYPTEAEDLELNQIDWLKRYGVPVGLSTHQHDDWHDSMLISYAKGARVWERHIDIGEMTPYNSSPEQMSAWYAAYRRAKTLCGSPGCEKRLTKTKERLWLDETVRGFYARRNLKAGETITLENSYLAIPLLKGQMSCREHLDGEVVTKAVAKDSPLMLDAISTPYNIPDRGLSA